jgi:hypothetical protein
MELMSAGRVCFADPLEQTTINLTKNFKNTFLAPKMRWNSYKPTMNCLEFTFTSGHEIRQASISLFGNIDWHLKIIHNKKFHSKYSNSAVKNIETNP